jgi:hypothetical protein
LQVAAIFWPLAELTAVTCTPGSALEEGSVTVPEALPTVVWAQRPAARRRR